MNVSRTAIANFVDGYVSTICMVPKKYHAIRIISRFIAWEPTLACLLPVLHKGTTYHRMDVLSRELLDHCNMI